MKTVSAKSVTLGAVVFLIASGAGFVAANAASNDSPQDEHPQKYAAASGPIDASTEYEALPDRIPVTGDHLRHGYADKKLVLGAENAPAPSSPEEALRLERASKLNAVVAPVYDAAGKQIDTFTVGEVNVPNGKQLEILSSDG